MKLMYREKPPQQEALGKLAWPCTHPGSFLHSSSHGREVQEEGPLTHLLYPGAGSPVPNLKKSFWGLSGRAALVQELGRKSLPPLK